MQRFVKIEYHDYMDLHPNVEVRVFKGENQEDLEKNVNEYVAHMKSHWCSGTTRLIGIMDESEALKHIEEQIAKEHSNWQDDSEEFINNICTCFKECYNKDAEELLRDLDAIDTYIDRGY